MTNATNSWIRSKAAVRTPWQCQLQSPTCPGNDGHTRYWVLFKNANYETFNGYFVTGAPKGFRSLSSLFLLSKEIRWIVRSVKSESSCQSQTSNNIFLQAEMQFKPENTNQPLATNQPGATKTRPVGSPKLCRFCKNAWITSRLQRSQDR